MVYVKTKGQDAVMNVIGDMAARGVNTRPLMGTIGHIILSSVTKNFESEGRPSKWKPLSELTKEIYAGRLLERLHATKGFQRLKKDETRSKWETNFRGKSGGKLLQQQGDLRKSIVIGKVTNTSVEVGSPLIYARIHQLGGVIKPKSKNALLIPVGDRFLKLRKVVIPARPYLLLQNEDETFILRATKDYLMEATNHANLT